MLGTNGSCAARAAVRCVTILSVCAALGAFPPDAAAATVSVECSGGGTYSSIGDALTALMAVSHRDHEIQVSGTCRETVRIVGMENLRIVGTSGATLEDPGEASPFSWVLGIDSSLHVRLEGLTIRGTGASGRALLLVTRSHVDVWNCVFENSREGLFINQMANVTVHGSTIQDLQWYGVRVDANSAVTIGDVQNELRPNVIQRTGTGIIARLSGEASIHGATVIQENGTGISGQGGTVSFCCGTYEIGVINNGGTGLVLYPGSNLIIQGKTRIEGNGGGGMTLYGAGARLSGEYVIRDNGRTGILIGYAGSLWLEGQGTIEQHTEAGVTLVGGTARLAGQATIRNNGTPGADMSGGVVATNGSAVSVYTGPIEGNAGPGLLVTHNSTARVQAKITANQGEGIWLGPLSSLTFFAVNSISGNTGFDLACAPGAYASGDTTGIERISCPGLNRPVRRGPDGW